MNKGTILKELSFKAIRSSGAGGQHVNKVSSKVVLSFDVVNSKGLSGREKTQLYKKLASRLTTEKILLLTCDESKSQLQNKAKVTARFLEIIVAGLFVPKRRKASKPSKSSIRKMKDKKQKRAELKKSRKKPNID